MADKRKARKKKEELDDKPTKEEYAVAKYLRAHLPVKKTTLLSHKVEYFIASKAVDSLLDSQWSSSRKGKNAIFTSRESVVEYLNTMLIHKFFHRAKKITVSQKELKAKKKSKNEKEDESSHAEDSKDKKSVKRKDKSKEPDEKKESGVADGGGKDKKKEKRKVKLDMHLEQVFLDGNEAYVWIYDPIPTTAWLIGGLLVVGAILLCLFPLWPSSVRKGVYYISIAAAGFLCVIVALIFARIVIFCLIWAVTFGRHHLWILPNLTEDVGFFESFWPLYKYEYKGSDAGEEGQEEKEKQKKKKKAKDSDDEDNQDDKKQGSETEKDNADRDSDKEATDSDRESEDSREQNRRGSSNQDNGFEMVNQDDVEHESGNRSKKHSGVMPVSS